MNVEEKREYDREWMKGRRRAWLEEHGPCVTCGTWENLEIDHIDPTEKEFNPGKLWSWRKERRDAELAKCQVLCKPCHIRKTNVECGRSPERQHGEYAMYRSGRCRCVECKAANLVVQRAWRARRQTKLVQNTSYPSSSVD